MKSKTIVSLVTMRAEPPTQIYKCLQKWLWNKRFQIFWHWHLSQHNWFLGVSSLKKRLTSINCHCISRHNKTKYIYWQLNHFCSLFFILPPNPIPGRLWSPTNGRLNENINTNEMRRTEREMDVGQNVIIWASLRYQLKWAWI